MILKSFGANHLQMIQLNIKDEMEMGKSLHETYHKNLQGTFYFLLQDSHEIDLIDKNLIYRKVASSNTSRLEPHAGFFRLLMKGIFDPYVL